MLFMVIERFRNQDAKTVYHRFSGETLASRSKPLSAPVRLPIYRRSSRSIWNSFIDRPPWRYNAFFSLDRRAGSVDFSRRGSGRLVMS